MSRISPHFQRHEFACKCGCGFSTIDVDLIKILEKVRTHFNKPVTINSACRCIEHNEHVQREANPEYIPYSSNSKHMQGIAADIVVRDTDPSEVHKYLSEYLGETCGLGKYNSFTHIDSRSVKARW